MEQDAQPTKGMPWDKTIMDILENTKPARRGRRHKLDRWREEAKPFKGLAIKIRRDIDHMRGCLVLGMCESNGIITEQEADLLLQHGRATLQAIGHMSEIPKMIEAVKTAVAHINLRQELQRSGWDVYGTGKRMPTRVRVRDIIAKKNKFKY